MIFDVHNHVGIEQANYRRAALPYSQTLEDLDLKVRETEVTHCLVFPFVSYPVDQRTEDLRPATAIEGNAPYAAANWALLEELELMQGQTRTEYLPVAILDPARQPEAQVTFLERLHAKRPFCALKIQGTIIQSKVTALLEEGREFLDFARRHNLPFVIHSSVLPSDVWSQAHDIIDVAEKNPDLRFMVAHSCRFQESALERIAGLPNTWFDCSAHRIHCQLATMDSPGIATADDRFPSNYSEPKVVLKDLAEAYPEELIWGTDSPYYSWMAEIDGKRKKLLSSYAEEWACVAALPETLKQAIAFTNARAWLGYESN